MILPDRSLWRRINERYDAAVCLLTYYGSYEVIERAIGAKIASVVVEAIEFQGSPSLQSVFFQDARRARGKSIASPIYWRFMRQWWTLMDERSELWRIVKSVPVPCTARS